jgi:uncharacterized membrane protein YfcA
VLPLSAIALLAFASFFAGLVDAIAGGGGLVTVPSLLAAGLPPHVALGTNKGQAVFGAIASATSFWRRKGIDRARAPIAFACGFVGSIAGALALLAVQPRVLRPLIVVLLVAAGAVVAWPRKVDPAKHHGVAHAAIYGAITALGIGFYDGFFGPGTGTLLIVAFVLVFGESLTRASGNAKVVNLASNLAAVALFAFRGTILWRVALPMAAANALGASVGAHLAVHGGDRFVRVVVLIVVAALVAKLLLDLHAG